MNLLCGCKGFWTPVKKHIFFLSACVLEKMSIYYKRHINLLKQISKQNDHVIVTSWTLPQYERGKYLNDFIDDFGITKNINP